MCGSHLKWRFGVKGINLVVWGSSPREFWNLPFKCYILSHLRAKLGHFGDKCGAFCPDSWVTLMSRGHFCPDSGGIWSKIWGTLPQLGGPWPLWPPTGSAPVVNASIIMGPLWPGIQVVTIWSYFSWWLHLNDPLYMKKKSHITSGVYNRMVQSMLDCTVVVWCQICNQESRMIAEMICH